MNMSKIFATTCALFCISAAGARSEETVIPKFEGAITNIPGKPMVVEEVTFPPGPTSIPHHHAKSAFLYAYVLSGTIRSQVEGEPARIFHAGEGWYEAPGAHHILAQNMSKSKEAKLLAVFVVDTSDKALYTPDTASEHGHE